MIKGAVFDMDGLMFDSELLTYNSWQKTMDEEGFDYNFDIFKSTVGLRTVETKKLYENRYGIKFKYDYLREKASACFWDYVNTNGMPLKKGLINILDFLKANKIQISLATSTSSASATAMLKKADVIDYFDEMVCGDMVKNSKPHPEVFLTAADKLGIIPQECVAFEDSINGIKSAYAAKMKPIMVPDLLEPTEEIMPMIYALCKDLDEAIEVIKNI